MKICFLTERMRLGFGVDLVVDQQARGLVERGHEVVVVVIHADLELPPLPYQLIVINKFMPLGDFRSDAWMKHVLALCRVDADLWILATPPFYDWANFLDGPVIAVEYGAPPGHMFSTEIGQHLDSMVARRFDEIYGNLLPCDAIVSISESIHRWLPEHARPFSTVVPLGCDHYGRASRHDAQALRASLGVEPEDCLIIWVGRMQLEGDEQPYKGFHDLLALIDLARPRLSRAKFVLAGRINDKDKHRLEARGLALLPNLPPDELACAYAAADVLINLSKWEGFNLALLEAQYQGTPPVAFRFGPHLEIVRDKQTGILANSTQDFYQSVVRISCDRELRERLAAQTLGFSEQFSWKVSLDKFEKVIMDCVAKSPQRAEIAARRREAEMGRRDKIAPLQAQREIVFIQDLLALDGRDFVRAARQIVLSREPNEEFEALWLTRLRRGASKRTILLEMSEMAEGWGIYREFPGLRASLFRVKIARTMRRLTRKKKTAEAFGVWLDVQDEIFVRHAYRVLLGREAVPHEIGPKVEQLHLGRSRQSLLAEMRCSEEGRNRTLEDPELVQLLALQPSDDSPNRISAPERCQPVGAVYYEWSLLQELQDNILSFGRPISSCKWFRYDDEQFVRQASAVLLGRGPHPVEVAARLDQLCGGRSRQSILAEMRFSEEGHRRRLKDRDLRRILLPEILKRRPPSPPRQPEIPLAARVRQACANLMSLVKDSPVSQWDLIEDEVFVRRAFFGLLGREVDPSTAAGLLSQLRDGRGRRSILAEIRFSEEGKVRRLVDPELRRILFVDELLRTPPGKWVFPARVPGDHEPEDTSRKVRRIDSRQGALMAKVDGLKESLSQTAQATTLDQSLGSVLGKLDALERTVSGLRQETSAPSLSSERPLRGQQHTSFIPFAPPSGPLRLGALHVALVSPNAALDLTAFSRIAEVAQTTGADIVFGDELEWFETPPFERLRIHGPFSHEAFLSSPDLGSVIAVREDLLARLHLPPVTALTGNVALRLVSVAHKVTYLPYTLGRRGTDAISGNLPTIEAMTSYVRGIDRKAVIESAGSTFDVRFPAITRWKAAIVIIAGRDDDFERAVATLQALTPSNQYTLTVARFVERMSETSRREPERGNSPTVLSFPRNRTFGSIINDAIAQSSNDCNIAVIMQGGVSPTSTDWLERLAESALRPSAGVVAPITLYPNGCIRHAGLAVEGDDFSAYVSRFVLIHGSHEDRHAVDLDRLKGSREVSAVSHHCMAFRRSVFIDQGKFDVDLCKDVSDVEFCCRVRRAGLSVLLDGRVVMVQDDPQPRWSRMLAPDQLAAFKAKHGRSLPDEDPFWVPSKRRKGSLASVHLPRLKER